MKYPIQVLFREYFEGILAAIFLAFFLRFFVFSVLYIPTENMRPTLVKGDFVMGWRLAYGLPLPLMRGERLNFKAPKRGDLISFRFPGDEEQTIIRRVIGLPGDTIQIEAGQVSVNGHPLFASQEDEFASEQAFDSQAVTYLTVPNPRTTLAPVQVPEGQIFVLTDNRLRSDDSRDWGFVPFLNVESQIFLVWLSVENGGEGLQVLWPRIFKTL